MRLPHAALALIVLATPSLADEKAEPQSLRVAAVQMRSTRDLETNLQAIQQHLRNCAAEGARVAVFPECALSGYFDDEHCRAVVGSDVEQALQAIGQTCREVNINALIGTALRDGEHLYNSGVFIDAQGQILERYHKVQLAERWPESGDHLSVFKIDGVTCSMIVCHDSRYPELVRLPVLAGAQVVFYLSHESGLRQEHKIDPYRAQIQARAVENTVYVVQANAPANEDLSGSHGQSRVVAPDGNIVDEASQFNEETVVADLDLGKATRNFARRSLETGALQEWWREGLSRVRTVEPPQTAATK